MSTPNYYLRKHVFYCLAEGNLVFLDLLANRYLALDTSNSKLFTSFLNVASNQDGNGVKNSYTWDEPKYSELRRSLVENDLVTQTISKGKPARQVEFRVAKFDLMGFDLSRTVQIKADHFWAMLKATIIVGLQLKLRPLTRVVQRAKHRKENTDCVLNKHITRTGQTMTELEDLVETFKTLRPVLYTAKNRCLFDSLVLAEFLASYEICPDVVIAVKGRPFAAHCWVQIGDVVLNDCVENVAGYQSLLII